VLSPQYSCTGCSFDSEQIRVVGSVGSGAAADDPGGMVCGQMAQRFSSRAGSAVMFYQKIEWIYQCCAVHLWDWVCLVISLFVVFFGFLMAVGLHLSSITE
jgi:hypothetical protein